MERKVIQAAVREVSGGEVYEILSPAVGLFEPSVKPGRLLVPGDIVGVLSILGERMEVAVPLKGRGEVLRVDLADRFEPVEYGQPLLQVQPGVSGEWIQDGGEPTDVPEELDGILIKAPTAGVFYRRANPTSEAYVEVGAKVRAGQTLGLVEVMKCFNQVRFEGGGLPGEATVLQIRAEDGAEVANDQVLFVLGQGG